MSKTYGDLPNERVSGANGVDYAYRDTGGDQAPLVLLQHFRTLTAGIQRWSTRWPVTGG